MHAVSFVIVAAIVGEAVGVLAPMRPRAPQQNPSPLKATLDASWFDVEVQIGSQTFNLLVDTGTSDTWVAKTGYVCLDPFRNTTGEEEICGWRPTYDAPSSLRFVQDQVFGTNNLFGLGQGKLAYEDITIGGITVSNQIFGLLERTAARGSKLNSGVLGLGFPTLSSAYPANFSGNATSRISNRIIYDPPFVSMFEQGLIEPWYSIALERLPGEAPTGTGGWLGLGELPPVQHTDDWAVAPIEITDNVPEFFYQQGPEITTLALTVESVSWGVASSPNTSTVEFQAGVISTGPINLVPAEIADSLNSQFDPPAVFDESSQRFIVDCKAKAPVFGVEINGQTFWHEAADLIVPDPWDERCYSGINRPAEGYNGTKVNMLGVPFLKNVVSVFDFGKKEMRFAARTNAASPSPTPSPARDSSGTRLFSSKLCLGLGLIGWVVAGTIV
ncbi:putative aspartic-type endopeptidase [Paramyrothecium foliicola]|nr:putative aspartic-type endopeptidase [Paramyrothecium foliicola]